MILLNEATTEQILDELYDRSKYMLVFATIPSNDEELVIESWKGSHIERAGLVNMANAYIKYHNYMIRKDKYNDDPTIYFGEENDD